VSSEWARGLPRWQPHIANNGEMFSLAHLHPHRYVLHLEPHGSYPACDVEIRIGYSSHPFTVSCKDGETGDAPYSKLRDQRIFCPDRYKLSFKLREIMESIDSRRCYATEHRNFFVIQSMEELPNGTEYWVFFNPKAKGPAAIELFIESAYAGDTTRAPRSRRRESVVFRALITKTLGLKKQTPP
jgi:hypothetical protein